MKLITKAIREKLKQNHRLIEVRCDKPIDDLKVVLKLFTPDSFWSWYIVSADFRKYGDGDEPDTDVVLYGLCCGQCKEWGDVSLTEIASVRGPYGLHIERDMHWNEITVGELKELVIVQDWDL